MVDAPLLVITYILPKLVRAAAAVAAAVPPLATGNVPVTPVVSGSPVPLVRTTADGVPSAGVVNTGEVNVLFVSVCTPVLFTRIEVSATTLPVLVIVVKVVPYPAETDVTVPLVVLGAEFVIVKFG